jgi:hypothetical protein
VYTRLPGAVPQLTESLAMVESAPGQAFLVVLKAAVAAMALVQ